MNRLRATDDDRCMLVGHTMADADGRLLAIDPVVCEILQRDARELLGMSYVDLTHPDDRARNVEMVRRLCARDGPIAIRKRYVRPDGSTVWADVQVSRFADDGDTGRLVGTIRVRPDEVDRCPARLWRLATKVERLVRQRRAMLGDDLFSDNAWLVLLQLYLAEAEGRVADADRIADRASIRAPLVARWLVALADKGLVERPALPAAAQLTAFGVARVEDVLAAMVED